MNTVKTIAKNTVAMVFIKIFIPFFSLALIWCIARYLGVSDLGKYTFIIAFFAIFSRISLFGLDTLVTREVAKDLQKASKYLTHALVLGFISSLFFIVLMYLTAKLMDYQDDVILLTSIISISLIFSSAGAFCESLLRAFEKFEYIAYASLAESVLRVSLGVFLLLNGFGLIAVIIAVVIASILKLFLSLYFVMKYCKKPQLEIDINFCKRLARETLFFAGISIIASIYWRIDIIMISKLKNMEEVGLYGAAFKILNIFFGIIYSYTLAIFPVVSRMYQSSLSSFKHIFEKSIKYLFIIFLPITVAITILSRNFILLIYGEKFLGAIPALQILIWTLVPYCVAMTFAKLLIASGNQKIDFQINIICIICNIILNFILIQKMGYIGASIATFISMSIFSCLQFIFISKNMFKINFVHILKKIVGAVIIMGVFIFLLQRINLVLLAVLSLIIYSLSLFLLKIFTKEDLTLFKKLIIKDKYF